MIKLIQKRCTRDEWESKSGFNTVSDDVPFTKLVLIANADSIIRICCILQ